MSGFMDLTRIETLHFLVSVFVKPCESSKTIMFCVLVYFAILLKLCFVALFEIVGRNEIKIGRKFNVRNFRIRIEIHFIVHHTIPLFINQSDIRTLSSKGKQNSLFPAGPVIKCFVIPPNSKIEKKLQRNRLLDSSWLTNLPRFQGTRPDHVRVESEFCSPSGILTHDT